MTDEQYDQMLLTVILATCVSAGKSDEESMRISNTFMSRNVADRTLGYLHMGFQKNGNVHCAKLFLAVCEFLRNTRGVIEEFEKISNKGDIFQMLHIAEMKSNRETMEVKITQTIAEARALVEKSNQTKVH